MNPSPIQVVQLFTFVEVTLVQYATVAGCLAAKAKPKTVNKVEVVIEEHSQRQRQKPALLHRDPKAKDPIDAPLLPVLLRLIQSQQSQRRLAKEVEKGKKGKSEQKPEKRRQQCIPSYRGTCKRRGHCNYEHQVDGDGKPTPVRPGILG